ncbi:MAG: phosphatase PAP2 family protein [Pseudomonadota bacterium]|jgi:undecaprenyl-diphosphatase
MAEARLLRRVSGLWDLKALNYFFIVFTKLGDWPLYIVLAAGLLITRGRTAIPALAAGGLSISMSVATFVLVKNLAHRSRPFEKHPDLSFLLAPPDRFSFPSGHTMTGFAAWSALSAFIPPLGLFLLVCAILIGSSRVYLGCHYPTDVLAGALLGSVMGKAAVTAVQAFIGM